VNEVIDVTPIAQALKWYHYNQNNSGGYFIKDEMVCEDVFIQARDCKEADAKAEVLFESRSDYCPCCGERWYIYHWKDDGTAQPEIYGEVIWDAKPQAYRDEVRLHFWDGRVEKYVYGMPRIE